MSHYSKKTYSDIDLPTDLMNPAWIITPKEEKVIFDRWRKKAFARCDNLIKAYIECSNSNGNMEGLKACHEISEKAQGCVAKYQKMKYLDEERDIMIQEKLEKQKIYRRYIEDLKKKQSSKE